MLTDTEKIISFFGILITLATIYRRRTNRASNALLAAQSTDQETHQELPAQDSSLGLIPGLGPSIALPEYEDKVVHVRRLSAYPEMDEVRRVSAVSSTLGDAVAQQQERARRGSGDSVLLVTGMRAGHVGVERRASMPDTEIRSKRRRSGSIASLASTSASTTKDPGSPRDKRFSMHLSYIVPPSHVSPVDPNQPMETLTTPLPPPVSAIPLPPLASPRSPLKPKNRPDSVQLAIARSPTLISISAVTTLNSAPPSAAVVPVESPHTEPGQLFKGWEGFSPSPPTALLSLSLGVTVDGEQRVLPTRRSSLDGRPVAKIDFTKKRRDEDEGKGADKAMEVLISPAGIALPLSPT